jgi:hypothetical protein
MAPAPVTPTPEALSGAAQFVEWLRDWWTPLLGGGFLLWLLRAAQWKRDVERTQSDHQQRLDALEAAGGAATQAEHGRRLDKLEEADDARVESHNKLALAVEALPRREEVRGMINDLRDGLLASLQAAGGRN